MYSSLYQPTSESRPTPSQFSVLPRWLSALTLSVFVWLAQNARGQAVITDNFDDGDIASDPNWATYDGGGATDGAPTYDPSFPNDPAGGKFYRILMHGSQS